MTTTARCRVSFTTAIAMLLTVLAVTLTATPPSHLTKRGSHPATEAAAWTGGITTAPTRQRTIATTDGELQQDQTALTYTQALRLMRTVTPGLVDITATLPSGGKAGTGIVISGSGLVLTNDHVISGSIALSVHDLGDGLDYGARIVGVDKVHDIAVLALDGATHLHTARLGGRVGIGSLVASIGNADGIGDPSLGAGPVVALHQSIASTTGQARPLTGLIEATNGVEPGESGGPLVTASGAVVGVTVATQLDGAGNPDGRGYAIPIGTAMAAAHRILARA